MVNSRIVMLLLTILMGILPMAAQDETVSGRVVDRENKQALEKATLQLYRLGGGSDTTYVAGAYSDKRGQFSFSTVRAGSYVLKVTYLGYKQQNRKR